MKKYLSILLAVLIISACATTDANAKRRTNTKSSTTKTTVNKEDFVKYWSEYGVMHPFQLEVTYNSDNDTFTCILYSQVEMCTGTGRLQGNTINFKCNKGFKITATLNGDILKVKVKDRYKTYNCKMR